MISPTIGRVVLFYDSYTSKENGAQPWPALVCHVWGDRCVNIAGFTSGGMFFSRSSVQLLQDEDEPASAASGFAEWMPYQKGQAAKAEALEQQLATTNPVVTPTSAAA